MGERCPRSGAPRRAARSRARSRGAPRGHGSLLDEDTTLSGDVCRDSGLLQAVRSAVGSRARPGRRPRARPAAARGARAGCDSERHVSARRLPARSRRSVGASGRPRGGSARDQIADAREGFPDREHRPRDGCGSRRRARGRAPSGSRTGTPAGQRDHRRVNATHASPRRATRRLRSGAEEYERYVKLPRRRASEGWWLVFATPSSEAPRVDGLLRHDT